MTKNINEKDKQDECIQKEDKPTSLNDNIWLNYFMAKQLPMIFKKNDENKKVINKLTKTKLLSKANKNNYINDLINLSKINSKICHFKKIVQKNKDKEKEKLKDQKKLKGQENIENLHEKLKLPKLKVDTQKDSSIYNAIPLKSRSFNTIKNKNEFGKTFIFEKENNQCSLKDSFDYLKINLNNYNIKNNRNINVYRCFSNKRVQYNECSLSYLKESHNLINRDEYYTPYETIKIDLSSNIIGKHTLRNKIFNSYFKNQNSYSGKKKYQIKFGNKYIGNSIHKSIIHNKYLKLYNK